MWITDFFLYKFTRGNGYRIYMVDILTRENQQSIQVANMDLIYLSVRSSSQRREDGENGVDGKYRYFNQLRVLLNYHLNLVQHPSNNIYRFLRLCLQHNLNIPYPKRKQPKSGPGPITSLLDYCSPIDPATFERQTQI